MADEAPNAGTAEGSAPPKVKPGIKTTELIVSAIPVILGVLLTFGVIDAGQYTNLLGVVSMVGGGGFYAISRGLAKMGK